MIESSVFEEVIQIRMSREIGGRALYWVAAYLVDGLLIDTGCSYTSKELLSFLAGKDVRLAVNTHFHEDHVGGNRDIINALGIPVYAHPDSVPLIGKRQELFPYQEMVWGHPAPSVVEPVPEIIRTEHCSFTVMETPGHSAGHIALAEPARGWFFTGDIFSREKPKFIRPEENIGQTIASMRRIMEVPAGRHVLFTSVGKIVENGRAALGASVDYLTGLAGSAKRLKGEGMGPEDIMKELFGGEHDFARLTDGQYTTLNLVRSLLEAGGA
ncbi:MAG: MBL fold metallo-hydrolase [Spirochaetes bacterium]|nr:MBL fold metallo-hydrolase [Spirochaetota bacterium]